MPLYEYRCPFGHVVEEYRPVLARERAVLCSCGEWARKIILHAPRVFSDYAGYTSPASGAWVEGRRARTEDMKRTGSRPYEAGEREMAQLARARQDAEMDSALDAAVDATINDIASGGESGKENLIRG